MLGVVSINWLAVVAAAIVTMAIGATLYSPPVLGERWLGWVGLRRDSVPKEEAMRSLLVAGVLSILVAIIMAMIVDWANARNAAEGVLVGLGVGVVAAAVAVENATFEMRPAALGMVYAAHRLALFAILGALLGGWQ